MGREHGTKLEMLQRRTEVLRVDAVLCDPVEGPAQPSLLSPSGLSELSRTMDLLGDIG